MNPNHGNNNIRENPRHIQCLDLSEMAVAASNWCQKKIEEIKPQSMFIPAGQTPVPLYQFWESKRPEYLQGLDLLQIDEVLTGSQMGIFRRFFESELPHFQKQLTWIEKGERIGELAILGLGMNGHVAFHEPGVDLKFFSGCLQLTQTTCSYLNLDIGTWGLSYGVDAFRRSKALLLMVSGSRKRDILDRLIRRDPSIPAASLLNHPDCTLIFDREARPLDWREKDVS